MHIVIRKASASIPHAHPLPSVSSTKRRGSRPMFSRAFIRIFAVYKEYVFLHDKNSR